MLLGQSTFPLPRGPRSQRRTGQRPQKKLLSAGSCPEGKLELEHYDMF